MAAWPNTLPRPQIDGYGLQPVDPVVRTDMETGASRSRRRTRARHDRVSVSWLFTDAQYAAFRTWFDSDAGAAGGAAWFDIDLAIGAGGITAQSARFASIWKSDVKRGLHWVVAATLEVR